MFTDHKSKKESRSGLTLCNPVDYTVHGILQARNTGVGSLSLHQGIFLTQGSNPALPHCRCILYQLSHKRSPRIREWVANLFSRGSSQPRDQTGVSYIAGRFFTNWAIREARHRSKLEINSKNTSGKFSNICKITTHFQITQRSK